MSSETRGGSDDPAPLPRARRRRQPTPRDLVPQTHHAAAERRWAAVPPRPQPHLCRRRCLLFEARIQPQRRRRRRRRGRAARAEEETGAASAGRMRDQLAAACLHAQRRRRRGHRASAWLREREATVVCQTYAKSFTLAVNYETNLISLFNL